MKRKRKTKTKLIAFCKVWRIQFGKSVSYQACIKTPDRIVTGEGPTAGSAAFSAANLLCLP